MLECCVPSSEVHLGEVLDLIEYRGCNGMRVDLCHAFSQVIELFNLLVVVSNHIVNCSDSDAEDGAIQVEVHSALSI